MYINREEAKTWIDNAISLIPAADVVSKAAYDQVAWERHLAEVQLKSIGKSLGEKMDDVQPVVRCINCKNYEGLACCKLIGDCGGTNWFCGWGEPRGET